MRVADPDAIRKGESALAEAIASNLDPRVIREIFKRCHNLEVGDGVKCRNASIGVHGDRIAYSVDFEVLVNLSVFLDRSGNFISVSSSGITAPSTASQKPTGTTTEERSSREAAPTDTEGGSLEENDPTATPGTYESVLREFAAVQS